MEIQRSVATRRRAWRIKDFLLKFRVVSETPLSLEEMKQRGKAWITGLAAVRQKRKSQK